jgi:hypothetical protein
MFDGGFCEEWGMWEDYMAGVGDGGVPREEYDADVGSEIRHAMRMERGEYDADVESEIRRAMRMGRPDDEGGEDAAGLSLEDEAQDPGGAGFRAGSLERFEKAGSRGASLKSPCFDVEAYFQDD